MTPHQKEVLQLKINKIRAILAAEKRRFGCYDDSRGLRYAPIGYYLRLQDYQGGLVYLRWFSKNFPDDVGFPEFLFEWAVILFKCGKLKEAERKAIVCFFRNTYVFDKFFGRPMEPSNKLENWNIESPEYLQDFRYSCTQSELVDFSKWLSDFEVTEKFKSIAKRYIDARIRLQNEEDIEMRHYLVRIDRQLLNEL